MPYVPAICPKCGGELQLDVNMEKGYCIHCGSLINFSEAVKNVKPKGPIEFAGYESLPVLLNYIERDLNNGNNQTEEFKSYLIRALELDADNEYLYGLVHSEIWLAKIENHVLVEYAGKAKKVVVPEGVTTIGTMAFAHHNKMVEIILPKSVTSIMPNAFIYEDRLTISAYKSTYAAAYALNSPAKLNLLGYKNQTEIDIEEIEYILREMELFRKRTEQKIEDHFVKAYSPNVFLVFLAMMPGIFIVINTLISYTPALVFALSSGVSTVVSLLGALNIVAVLFLAVMSTGYEEIRRKVATKRQIAYFIEKCNKILKPLGIIDFKYHKNIIDSAIVDLTSEIAKLKNAKYKVMHMSMVDVYKKPFIDYTLIDFIKGERPPEYKN